jgi:hypothetical protein
MIQIRQGKRAGVTCPPPAASGLDTRENQGESPAMPGRRYSTPALLGHYLAGKAGAWAPSRSWSPAPVNF